MRRDRPKLRIRRRLPLEDIVCSIIFCFFAMQGAIPFIAPTQSLEMTGSVPGGLTTIGGLGSQAIVNALILGLILRRPRLLLRRIAEIPWLLVPAALAGLIIASAVWSLDPILTLRRSIPFALAGLFGLWFATRYSLERQLAILRGAMIFLALASIALVFLDPTIGLDRSPGHAADWKGVFAQKNACGRMMVLASSVIFFAEGTRLLRPRRLTALALFVFVLVMSGSRGAWMIEICLLLLLIPFIIARQCSQRIRLVLALAMPLMAIGTGTFFLVDFHSIAPLLGRDPTLTGRTAIWAQVVHFVWQRPTFGYGYDAFWRGMEGPSLQVAVSVHFIVAHAHNGFLEIALELGGAGFVLFALTWLRGWFALWPLWQRGNLDRIAWPMAFLALIVLYDLDENTLLIYNGLFWPLYVSALVSIESLRHPAFTRSDEEECAGPIERGLSDSERWKSQKSDLHHTAAFGRREILKCSPRRAMRLSKAAQEVP